MTDPWLNVTETVTQIVADSDGRIQAETILKVMTLIEHMRGRCSPPDQVLPPYESEKVYTGSISFYWEETASGWLEIEVEEGCFDILRQRGETSTAHTVWSATAEPLPEALVAELPKL